MRDLLLIIAAPALAKRDEKLRTGLTEIVGKSKAKAKAVSLMDGTKQAAAIYKEAGIDQGDLSRLTKALRANSLISEGKQPKLLVSIPPNFFENAEKKNG